MCGRLPTDCCRSVLRVCGTSRPPPESPADCFWSRRQLPFASSSLSFAAPQLRRAASSPGHRDQEIFPTRIPSNTTVGPLNDISLHHVPSSARSFSSSLSVATICFSSGDHRARYASESPSLRVLPVHRVYAHNLHARCRTREQQLVVIWRDVAKIRPPCVAIASPFTDTSARRTRPSTRLRGKRERRPCYRHTLRSTVI